MSLRRGFKSEANGYARDMRDELGLPAHAPLCPWKLSVHLGFKVVDLSVYAQIEPKAVSYLQSGRGQKEFSAITLCGYGVRWIVHNDAHHPYRQAANIAHELAHGLLIHQPAPLTGADGARTFNAEQEEEAHWLGPALLVSEEAAVMIAAGGQPLPLVQQAYKVSEELLQMRLRVTGALIRAARRKVA